MTRARTAPPVGRRKIIYHFTANAVRTLYEYIRPERRVFQRPYEHTLGGLNAIRRFRRLDLSTLAYEGCTLWDATDLSARIVSIWLTAHCKAIIGRFARWTGMRLMISRPNQPTKPALSKDHASLRVRERLSVINHENRWRGLDWWFSL